MSLSGSLILNLWQSHLIFLPSILMQHFEVLVLGHAGGHRFHIAGWYYELDGAIMQLLPKLLALFTSLDDREFSRMLNAQKSSSNSPVPLFVAFSLCCFDKKNNPWLPCLVNCSGSEATAEHVLTEDALRRAFARIRTSSFVSGCVLWPPTPRSFFASCRRFSDFSLPQSFPHQWFLFFGVNIPAVCVWFLSFCFLYTALLLPLRASVEAVWSMQQWGSHDTDHTPDS